MAYSFIPAEPFAGRPFGLSVNMAYRDAVSLFRSILMTLDFTVMNLICRYENAYEIKPFKVSKIRN